MSDHGEPGSDEQHGTQGIRSGRAIILVAIGVVLGVFLLRSVGKSPAGSVASVAAAPAATTSTVPPPTTTTTAAPRPPAQVKTLVANGTKTGGAGAKVSDTLRKAGYDVLAPTNTTSSAASSAVLFFPGYASEAGTAATALGLAPTTVMPVPIPAPVANAQAANVLVIVGPDLAGQPTPTSAPASPTSTTSTTVHPTPTTAPHATPAPVR